MSRTDELSPAADGQPAGARQPRYDQRNAGGAPGDRPAPYSYADLQQRLDRLPPGHPSSDYNADGSRRPPPLRLRDLELPLPGDGSLGDSTADSPASEHTPRDRSAAPPPPRPEPLTDTEHAEHIQYVEQRLDWARREGLSTEIGYTTDPGREQWAPHRAVVHRDIVDELYAKAADVPSERKAIMAGGLGGAGKSTVLEQHAGIDRSQYLTINPDDIKELMAERGLIPEVDGLSPMEASDLVHEESSYLAKQLALRAMADGKNVIWDITMSSRSSVESRLETLEKAGYTVSAIFVDIPVEVSVQRAGDRYWRGHEDYRNGEGQGGRYVPPEIIRSQGEPGWGSVNRRSFEQVKDRFDAWAVYDNSVRDRAPSLVASGGTLHDIEERT